MEHITQTPPPPRLQTVTAVQSRRGAGRTGSRSQGCGEMVAAIPDYVMASCLCGGTSRKNSVPQPRSSVSRMSYVRVSRDLNTDMDMVRKCKEVDPPHTALSLHLLTLQTSPSMPGFPTRTLLSLCCHLVATTGMAVARPGALAQRRATRSLKPCSAFGDCGLHLLTHSILIVSPFPDHPAAAVPEPAVLVNR